MNPLKLHSPALSRALSRALTSSTTITTPPQCLSSFPVKTVTVANFEPSLAALRQHVQSSDFVAIDLEMTGEASAPWRKRFPFDRSDVSYLKVKDSASKFAVVQFGVCPFRWDSSNQSFVAYPYNFYVFPREELAGFSPCHDYLFETDSMSFLAKHKFDFNTCIHQGISYLSREQEREAIKSLNYMHDSEWLDISKLNVDMDLPSGYLEDIFFADGVKNKFSEWLDGLLQEQSQPEQIISSRKYHDLGLSFRRYYALLGEQYQPDQISKPQIHKIFFKSHPALKLDGFDSIELKLIQWVIKKHFKDLAYLNVIDAAGSTQQIVVYTDSEDKLNLLLKEVIEENHRANEMKVQAAVGFRQVIDLLSSEQKLIVGHNCFLDIAHVYDKFIGPLPETPEEFAASVNKCFPHIVDTKVLIKTNDMLQTRLGKSTSALASAFSKFCPEIAADSQSTGLVSQSNLKIDVEVDGSRSSSWNPGDNHEAGYDAFMTGCIFAQSCSDLGVDFKLHESSKLAFNEKLQNYINRLYLNWMQEHTIDLSTGDKVENSSPSYSSDGWYPDFLFENIVVIWGLPSNVKKSDVEDCLLKVFGSISVDHVYYLDATAVFVQFREKELVSDFLSLMENNGPNIVLHPLSKILDGGNTRAATYDTYQEICGSPLSKTLFADQANAVTVKFVEKIKQTQLIS